MNEYIIRRSSTNARTDEDLAMSMVTQRVTALSAITLKMHLAAVIVENEDEARATEFYFMIQYSDVDLTDGNIWDFDGIRYTVRPIEA